MFCPFCKAEYRAGITHCSDCSFPLVDAIPKDDSDPNFMVLLWNGESLPFLEVVCKELDRAELSVATPRVEILLRDRADRYHLKHLSTFPYALGVFKRDFAAARKILELLAEKNLPPIALPPVAAYPEPFDERTTVAHRKGSAPLTATTTVYSSDDVRAMEFVEASLDGLDIPVRRVCLESGVYEIQVRPTSENAARRDRRNCQRNFVSASSVETRGRQFARRWPAELLLGLVFADDVSVFGGSFRSGGLDMDEW